MNGTMPCCADVILPGGQQIEALIRSGPGAVLLQRAPKRLGCPQVVKHCDSGDAARAWPGCRQDIFPAGVTGDGDAHCDCAVRANLDVPLFGLSADFDPWIINAISIEYLWRKPSDG